MPIPLGILWDFSGITTEFYELRKKLRELRRAIHSREPKDVVDAYLKLLEVKVEAFGKAVKEFSKKHLERAFQELDRESEFEQLVYWIIKKEADVDQRQVEKEENTGELKVIFVREDTWQKFQSLKGELLKEPNMTDDRMLRELLKPFMS